jgi:mono/diheme cytochrome c family protein
MQPGQTSQSQKGRFTMKSLATRAGVLLFALLFSTATLTMAQQSQTTVKKTTIPRTSAASGEEMFNTYCAVCHGKDAKGNGPAAAALKVPPDDLTTLAQRHGGKFPADYVATVLRSGVQEAKAHGSKDMPIWGPLFASLGNGSTASPEVAQRIHNLSQYIESLQAK